MFGAEYMGQGHPGFVLSWTQKIRNVFGMPTYDLLLARLVGVCKVWLWSVPGLLLLAFACVPVSGDESTRQRAASNEWQVVAALAASWLMVGSVPRAWQVDQFITDHQAQLPGGPDATATVRIVNPGSGYYAWDLVQNDPFLRGPIILASQGRQADAAMMAREPPQLILTSSRYSGQVWDTQR